MPATDMRPKDVAALNEKCEPYHRAHIHDREGTVARVAKQLGHGVESVRTWVNQADVDGGVKDGTSTEDAKRIKELEQEVIELRQANEILKKASAYFAHGELDRPPR
jgi:transposase